MSKAKDERLSPEALEPMRAALRGVPVHDIAANSEARWELRMERGLSGTSGHCLDLWSPWEPKAKVEDGVVTVRENAIRRAK